ncbi:hypothetical protein Tco_0721896 [Tanacetum coccineum]
MNQQKHPCGVLTKTERNLSCYTTNQRIPFGCRGGGGSGDVMVVRGDDDVVFGGWVAEEPIFIKRTLRCLQEANRTYFCDEVEVVSMVLVMILMAVVGCRGGCGGVGGWWRRVVVGIG